MGIEITARGQRMRARTVQSDHILGWVRVTVTDGRGAVSELDVFIDGERAAMKAQAYANAINAVDQQFHGVEDVLQRHIARTREPAL